MQACSYSKESTELPVEKLLEAYASLAKSRQNNNQKGDVKTMSMNYDGCLAGIAWQAHLKPSLSVIWQPFFLLLVQQVD